ncbi:MAG: LLM class flavin-dependent oxidoreductase [Rhizobiaceae bacterium]
MELGLYTFASLAADPSTGHAITAGQRIANLIEEAELADQTGLDVFGIGEHHRPDFAISTPAVMLAAIAARTKRIRLTSAVTVLSSDDPVRVFQEFSTVDLISGGRAEIMAGRGSFIESYPLFGFNLGNYDQLFAEKLELLLKIRAENPVTWTGETRAPLESAGIWPRPIQQPLPVWIAVGGTPQSVVRAGTLGLPLALAIIGGEPARFKPLVDLYRQAGARAGHGPKTLKVAINSHGFIAGDSNVAADTYFPPYAEMFGRIGRERGWGPVTRAQYEAGRTLRGALLVGSPNEIAEKILAEHELFANDRFMMQIDMGSLPHALTLKAIELFGTRVKEQVSRALNHHSS